MRLAPIAPAARASGAIVRTSAPRARSVSVSASAADWENARSAPKAVREAASDAVGLRHSTCVPRPTGVASRLVGLHTPPSTYSRPSIRTGAKIQGTEHEASTAWPTRARGAPGAPVDGGDPQATVEAGPGLVDEPAEAGHRAPHGRRGAQRGGTRDRARR